MPIFFGQDILLPVSAERRKAFRPAPHLGQVLASVLTVVPHSPQSIIVMTIS
jgi:hypothetical protein